MAFDLYLAGGAKKEIQEKLHSRGCCKLYSQLRERSHIKHWINLNIENDKYCKTFIDSGAFSAWTKGVELDVEDYINFINTYGEHVELFASIDNIPGRFDRRPTLEERKESPRLTWENYLYMRENINYKDKLLPTFHLGEDFKALQNILNTKIDGEYIPYIALGGTVGMSIPNKKKWYSTAFKIIKQSDNPNVKIHAFGMTSFDILEAYPFYSADSTSWRMTAVYGFILTEHGQIKVSDRASADDINTFNSLSMKQQDEVLGRLKELDVTLEQCQTDAEIRAYVNAMYQLDWAENYKYKGNNRYQKTLF